MELSPSDKKRVEHQFDRICKLAVKSEMKDYCLGKIYTVI